MTWKNIPGTYYSVSDTGLVRNNNNNMLLRSYKTGKRRNYETVGLYINGKKKNFKVHRLVAEAFIDNPENKPQVNHIDGNTSNNNVNNLEWVTNSENQLHAWKNGLQVKTSPAKTESCRNASKVWISKHPNGNNCSLTLEEVAEIKMMLLDNKLSIPVIANLYGVTRVVIRNIELGKTYKNVNIKEWL